MVLSAVCDCGISSSYSLTFFIYMWSTFTNLFPKIDYGVFVRLTATKMTAKMVAACQFALVDTLSHFITRFLSNSIGYMDYFYDNQAGCKHGCPHFTAGHLGPLFRRPTILVYIIEGVTATRCFSPLLGKIELASFSCINTISAPY